MKGFLLLGGAFLAAFLLISVLCLAPLASLLNAQQQGSNSAVAQAALALEQHIYGPEMNEYHDDAFMHPVIAYWQSLCHNVLGSLCSVAVSGNLQCVEFVAAAQWLAGNPLPAIDNAQDFWPAYAHEPGWREIPSPTSFPGAPPVAPQVGDLVVWQGGAHLEQQANGSFKNVSYGHIAVITKFVPPTRSTDGLIALGQANALAGAFSLAIHPDYTVQSWGPVTINGIPYSGESVLGYLHATTSPTTGNAGFVPSGPHTAHTLPAGLSFSTPFVKEAWVDAEAAGIPPRYFTAQIRQESGFNPNAVSPAGAIGIAQFMPGTAAGLGLDPTDPHASLRAAAEYMAQESAKYQGNYALALAAYNAGDGAVQSAFLRCGNTWLSCTPTETQNYVTSILQT